MSEIEAPVAGSREELVVFGGGTGSSRLIQAIREEDPEVGITGIINVADDGGSSGKLRQELEVSPPGDARQVLRALMPDEAQATFFNQRFHEGTLQGHPIGNLMLAAMEQSEGTLQKALDFAHGLYGIAEHHRAVTVTDDKTDILFTDSDGRIHMGESNLEGVSFADEVAPDVRLNGNPRISERAEEAIHAANKLIIAPGNLYRSIVPVLLVDGVVEAIKKSDVELIYVANLSNDPNHTPEFYAHDYAREIERFIGRGLLDSVIFNNGPSQLADDSSAEGLTPLNLQMVQQAKYRAEIGDYAVEKPTVADGTNVRRSRYVHDAAKLARTIMGVR